MAEPPASQGIFTVIFDVYHPDRREGYMDSSVPADNASKKGTFYHVLFLCTGNSARSVMAEAILNFRGRPNFTAFSAGSHPSGMVRPEALHQLQIAHIPTAGLRSKSWDEFAQPSSPKLDFVFTVCDNAAKEVCPIWPGQPVTAHWGVPDPAAVRGSKEDIERAFREAFLLLDRRINLFLALPLKTLDRMALQRQLHQIGHTLAPGAPPFPRSLWEGGDSPETSSP